MAIPQIGYIQDANGNNERMMVYGSWIGESNLQYAFYRGPGTNENTARGYEDSNDLANALLTIKNIVILYAGTSGGKTANSPVVPTTPVSGFTSLSSEDLPNNYIATMNFPYDDITTESLPTWVYIKSDSGTSSGYLVNRPSIYFLEKTTSAIGEINRVFGKNLTSLTVTSYGTQASLRKAKCLIIPQTADNQVAGNYIDCTVYPSTEGDIEFHSSNEGYFVGRFAVPAGTANGNYYLYWYIREGDTSGVAGPIALTVNTPASLSSIYIRKASLDGATATFSGNTTTADKTSQSSALQDGLINCLAQTSAGGGSYSKAVLLLDQAGVYHVDRPLVIPPGVELRGLGRDCCTIRYRNVAGVSWNKTPTYSASIPSGFSSLFSSQQPDTSSKKCFIRMTEDSNLVDINVEASIDSYTGVDYAIYVKKYLTATAQNVSIKNCRFSHPITSGLVAGASYLPSVVMLESQIDKFNFDSNEVISNCLAFYHTFSDSIKRNCRYSGNTFKSFNNRNSYNGVGNVLGIQCIFENNLIDGLYRGVMVDHYDNAKYQNYILKNDHRFGGSQEAGSESFHYEWVGDVYNGTVTNITNGGSPTFQLPSGVTYNDKDVLIGTNSLVNFYAVIIDGKGFGQYRRITANTGTSPVVITLENTWNVAPDTNSVICITRLFAQNVVSNWSVFNTKGGIKLEGKSLENVIVNPYIHNSMEGISILAKANQDTTNRATTTPFPWQWTWAGSWFNRILEPKLINAGIYIRADRYYDSIVESAPFRGIVGLSIHNGNIVNSPIMIVDRVLIDDLTNFEFDDSSYSSEYSVVKAFSENIVGVGITTCLFDLQWAGQVLQAQAGHRSFTYDVISLTPHGVKGIYTNNKEGIYHDVSASGISSPGENPVKRINKYLGY